MHCSGALDAQRREKLELASCKTLGSQAFVFGDGLTGTIRSGYTYLCSAVAVLWAGARLRCDL